MINSTPNLEVVDLASTRLFSDPSNTKSTGYFFPDVLMSAGTDTINFLVSCIILDGTLSLIPILIFTSWEYPAVVFKNIRKTNLEI
jgi:hypothetical protein